MIKTDSRESMTDQQRWVMDNLLGETVTSTQYEVANLPRLWYPWFPKLPAIHYCNKPAGHENL